MQRAECPLHTGLMEETMFDADRRPKQTVTKLDSIQTTMPLG